MPGAADRWLHIEQAVARLKKLYTFYYTSGRFLFGASAAIAEIIITEIKPLKFQGFPALLLKF
jgi:hypothetical protein